MSLLLPYDGLRVREHFGPGTGEHFTTVYGFDRSGTKSYRFNSLGFRGSDLSADAKGRIFVCGCSNTFGVGVNEDEVWPWKVRDYVAASCGLAPTDIDLVNFSQGGASNCYIARMLISQCTRVRPSLVLALFTYKVRYELYDHHRTVNVLPKAIAMYRGTAWQDRVEHSWLGLSDDDLAMKCVKNILMLQWYCAAHSIPFLFGSVENLVDEHFFEKLRTPVTAPLLDAIDFDKMVPLKPSMWIDKAADDVHPGPMSHSLIAEAFWNSCRERYRSPIAAMASRQDEK